MTSEQASDNKTTLDDMLQVSIAEVEVLISSSQIKEVVRPMPLTPVPMGPDHILGLANIHGQVVCVIDAAKVCGLPAKSKREVNVSTRFLLLRHASMHVAIWVDAVKRLQKVEKKALETGSSVDNDFIFQIQHDGKSCSVLDCSILLRN